MSHIDSPWSMPRTGKVCETISRQRQHRPRVARRGWSGQVQSAQPCASQHRDGVCRSSAASSTELLVPYSPHAPRGPSSCSRFQNPAKALFLLFDLRQRSRLPERAPVGAEASIIPPSDMIRPPSEAAQTLLRATAGRLKDTEISWAERVCYSSVVSFPIREKDAVHS